jgi:FG-GAP-like repeat
MQLRYAFAGLLSLLVGSTTAFASNGLWVEGSPVQTGAQCGGMTPGLVTRAGLFINEYVAEPLPVGTTVYTRGAATNQNCSPDFATVEVRLPAGANLAITSVNPVVCVVRANGVETPVSGCTQTPSYGVNGLVFAPQTMLLAGAMLEIRVPIVFPQATIANLDVFTRGIWGATVASTRINVPYQPGVPTAARGDDLVLVGSALADAGTLPTAFANDDGSFTVTNYPVGDFASWARAPGVTRLSGDFDRNGLVDIALVGGPGWNTIPVALARGDGMYTITNTYVGAFGAWASSPNVKPVTGDFNRDGYTDIALVGGIGWGSIPTAFSAGGGAFTVTNQSVANFPSWAQASGARPIIGDFNRDGMSDIALVGGAGWATLPVAYSYGNGTFATFNAGATGAGWNFSQTVSAPGSKLIVADFNRDGMSDLLVVGSSASMNLRFAISYGNGSWLLVETAASALGIYAGRPGAQVVTGDYNKDGWPDLAVTVQDTVQGVHIATNAGNYTFSGQSYSIGNFGAMAATPGVRAISGDFNGDGLSDIALTGGVGWASIPMAVADPYYRGFKVINVGTYRFPRWASDATATVFAGKANY